MSPEGNDLHTGEEHAPLKSLSAAAEKAMPGDTITVHAGTYRERVDPPRGGTSDDCRITYRAAEGETVLLKGSEELCGWTCQQDDIWTVRVPNTLFGDDNPYDQPLSGHWFHDLGRPHHRGAVYRNGHWLSEAESFEDLIGPPADEPRWFALVDDHHTALWAEFPGFDPEKDLIEINVRRTVFYPSVAGIHFITVQGFHMSQAATPWSPPTTEQIGVIGTNWSKGWIIEDNEVSYSLCAGITLGKYHDDLDFPEQPVVEGTEGGDTYHHTIDRALQNGWNFETVGHHVLRANHVHHCEQSGICGSLGPIGCVITRNEIHHIYVRRLFYGYEQAGLKFHGAIDTEISLNRIYNCYRGMWLDWMSQGTRVTRNLFYDNGPSFDLYMEVNHGPFVVDHNLFLSPCALENWSHGGAYCHNLMRGHVTCQAELGRETPWHEPHSTVLAGQMNIEKGDDKYINNLTQGLSQALADASLPVVEKGNAVLNDAELVGLRLEDCVEKVYLRIPASVVEKMSGMNERVVSDTLGLASIPGLPYQNPDGNQVVMNRDYFGTPRGASVSTGPFEISGEERLRLQVWPPLSESTGT